MKISGSIIYVNRTALHIIFSGLLLALLFVGMYFLLLSGFRFNNMYSAVTDCFFFLLCVYTGRWLCARWYLNKQFYLFMVLSIGAVVVLSVLKFFLVKNIFSHPNAGFMEVVRDAMPFFLTGLIMGMLLKLIRASMQKQLDDARAKAEQRLGELQLLQAQLSPHFLFNVLNNLYGISITDNNRIPSLLLKLSDLLRYAVYGTKKMYLPLKEEIRYIESYIEFETIRMSDRLVLETDIIKIIGLDIKIAPLILLVFVENAFKHAGNTIDNKIYIYISLKIEENNICFVVKNSFQKSIPVSSDPYGSSGIGITNTEKRLGLLYGNDYSLKRETDGSLYTVELKLKIVNE